MTISPNKWELDVQGYLNVCNITAATPRQQIRDFSKGVNDLGLWNSMVCWPLRSSQNAATGDTVFSLGGLGTFNGTMVNGPTRGADGMTGNGTNTYISTGFATNNLSSMATSSAFYCGQNLTTSGAAYVGSMGIFASVTDNFQLEEWEPGTSRRRGMIGDSNRTANTATPASTSFSAMSSTSASLLSLYHNGNLVGTNTNTRSPSSSARPFVLLATNILFGGTDGPAGFTSGTYSILGIFNAGISDQNVANIYSLYKNTLGQGLTGLT